MMSRLLRAFLSSVIQQGRLDVETANGARFSVGTQSGRKSAIRFSDRAAERALIFNPALSLGELYTDGRLQITQRSIYDLLDLVTFNLGFEEPSRWARLLTRLRTAMRPFAQYNTLHRSAQNVDTHYNIDGRLFDLFLDGDRQYSCAYFEHPQQSLDEAQVAKKRHIAAKLHPSSGQHVLDIGCGWGGLANYLAEHTGADVTAITLSEEQLAFARSRHRKSNVKSAGVVDFQLRDYRHVAGQFDRIVSVGMFEHVGLRFFDAFFRKAAELMTDDGVMVLHSIGRMDGPGATNPWIAKYIFPGGYFPALSEVLPSIEKAGLIVTDVEILRLHYAETLRHWRTRFHAHRTQASALMGERFCRIWEFYLAAAECSFRYSGLMVFQIQMAKHQEAVPLTRDFIGWNELALRRRELARSRLEEWGTISVRSHGTTRRALGS